MGHGGSGEQESSAGGVSGEAGAYVDGDYDLALHALVQHYCVPPRTRPPSSLSALVSHAFLCFSALFCSALLLLPLLSPLRTLIHAAAASGSW